MGRAERPSRVGEVVENGGGQSLAWQAGRSGRYKELTAWQKAYNLVLTVYKVTAEFPVDERFGLVSQARCAAVSIPSNIAEGWGRGSRTDYVRFLDIARGSGYELQTLVWLATDLGYVDSRHELHGLIEEVGRLLNTLIRSLREHAG